MTKTFETGKTYWTRSICDYDCIQHVTIIKRTAKSVWIKKYDGTLVRRALEVRDGEEFFYPNGRYSMASIISAGKQG